MVRDPTIVDEQQIIVVVTTRDTHDCADSHNF